MKFSKKDFKEKYALKDEPMGELFDPNGEFGGDKPNIAHTQVTTDTQKAFDDQSDFKQGIPQTTDDFAAKTKNKHNWFGQTNMGMPYGSGTNYRLEEDEELSETYKDKVKKLVKELIAKRNDPSGLVNKRNYSDVNRNNVPDMDDLENSVVSSKTKEFINSVNNNGLSGEQIGIILNHVVSNLNISEIPNDYKNMIKNKIK